MYNRSHCVIKKREKGTSRRVRVAQRYLWHKTPLYMPFLNQKTVSEFFFQSIHELSTTRLINWTFSRNTKKKLFWQNDFYYNHHCSKNNIFLQTGFATKKFFQFRQMAWHRLLEVVDFGSSICEHQRVRSTCKDCGGSSLCEHQRQRSKCKDCGGGISASTRGWGAGAKTAVAAASASTSKWGVRAKTAAAVASASTSGRGAGAKIVERSRGRWQKRKRKRKSRVGMR